jgi:hypothetical protein
MTNMLPPVFATQVIPHDNEHFVSDSQERQAVLLQVNDHAFCRLRCFVAVIEGLIRRY